MENAIKTKWAVGDVVYAASTDRKTEKLPCPDCKGSRKWKAVSPAGAEHEFNCPRCSTSYMSNNDLRLAYNVATPRVRKLTIGSIEYRSVGIGGGPPETRYMCKETGIGSGSVYGDDDLFATEERALARAVTLAHQQDESNIKNDKYWHGRLEISDYQLGDAQAEAAKRDLRRFSDKVREAAYEISSAIDMEDDLKAAVCAAFATLGHQLVDPA